MKYILISPKTLDKLKLAIFLLASTLSYGQHNLTSKPYFEKQKLTDVNIGSYIKKNLKILDISKGLNKDRLIFPKAPGQKKTISWENFRNTSIDSSGSLCLIDISEGDVQKKALISLINGAPIHFFGSHEKVFFHNNKVYVIRNNGLFEFKNKKYISVLIDLDLSKYNEYRKFGNFIILYDKNHSITGLDITKVSSEIFTNYIINLDKFEHEIHQFTLKNWVIGDHVKKAGPDLVKGWNSSFDSQEKKLSSLLALVQGSTYDHKIYVDRKLVEGESYEIVIQGNWYGNEIEWVTVNENGKAYAHGQLTIDNNIGHFNLKPPVGFPVLSFKNNILDLLIKKNGVGIDHYKIKLHNSEIGRTIEKVNGSNKIKVKPEKNKIFVMSEYNNSKTWNLLESESNNKLYFSSAPPFIYEFNTKSTKSDNYPIIEKIQKETALTSQRMQKVSDSIIKTKSDFQEFKDVYELFITKAETLKKNLTLKREKFYNKQFESIKLDTIQFLSMFNSSNYSLKEENYSVIVKYGEFHIPLKIPINKIDAEKITNENNQESYWIIHNVLSPLRKVYVPFFVELVFKNSKIFNSTVPEYSFELMDNLSFANNKYRDKKRHQEFNSEIFSEHISAGGVNNYFDYSNKFRVKRINKLGYQADFSEMQEWYLYDRLIDCCPRKRDSRDGNDGIGLYLGEYGLALNINLPYCDGHRKLFIHEEIESELIEEFNNCIQYWNKNGPYSIKRNFNFDKSKNLYSYGGLKINKNNNEIGEIDLLSQANFPKKINLLTYRISPNKKYIAVLINQILSIYRISDLKEISKNDLQTYFNFQLDDFYKSKISNRLYWDNNSNYLGYENLLFQIPLLENFYKL